MATEGRWIVWLDGDGPASAETVAHQAHEGRTDMPKIPRFEPGGHLGYYSRWREMAVTCPSCGWSGRGASGAQELFAELIDVSCPGCGVGLFLVNLPTLEDTEAAATEGNAEALEELDGVREMERARARIRKERKKRDKLPDIDGDALTFTFHTEGGDDWMNPHWLVLTCNGREIYRESSGFEWWEPIIEISSKVIARYPGRVAWIDPATAGDCLGGDDISYDRKIQAFLDANGVAPPTGNWATKNQR